MRNKFTRACLALLFPFTVYSQSYHPLFQDGKIWFKLANDTKVSTSLDENPDKIEFNSIPGFQVFVAKYGVTRLSKPFHAAKTSIELQRTYLVEFTDYSKIESFVKDLSLLMAVEYAEKVPLDHTCLTPNDPSYGSQWGLNMIGAPTAWDYFSSGSNIVIAIVDDAIERTHPDLSPNLWVSNDTPGNSIDDDGNGYIDDINGWDVGSNDNNPNPPNSSFDHGTHVAGISSASSNNGIGIASIGFSCKLMCIKATTTPTAITNGYDGIVYAATNGANVINMSWGGPTFTITGQNVVNYAWNQGCILVAAAGNDNVSSPFYPANMTNVISVAATNSGDAKASFSNYGNWIDISAPGNNIYSTTVGATYGYKSGTSMAASMVAGLIGLMKSLNPNIPNSDLINCLYTTSTNINTQNPSYIGQLGAGRINATDAMNCIFATLSNPPVADFVANCTTINAGGQVVFTDLSSYAPTNWNWSFPGGNPSSYNGQNPPPIIYNTPGTYNVTLTVTNANGADTQTNSSYITANPAAGCYKINLPPPAGWIPQNYYTGATVGQDGWINGMNIYLDKQKAMYFDASALPYTILNNVWIAFGMGYSANPSKIVPVKVYDGTGGTPGALLGTTNLTMGQIMSDVDGGYYTEASFINNPITLPASKKFFVAVSLTNLQWTAGVKDTLSIVSNQNGQTVPSAIWEQQADNLWYHYTAAGSWNFSASLYIHPFLTTLNSTAVINPSTTTICQNNSIDFDATGSTYEDTLLWYFPGGYPSTVSSDLSTSIMYSMPGTYEAILYTIGGGCHLFDSTFVNITVNANPTVSVTGNNTICNGGSTSIMASGASVYNWTPPTGLSATTGPSVTANPTTTSTYNVQGTAANGCTANTTIQITVTNLPVAVTGILDTIIGCTTDVFFDGSNSTDASTFYWTFPGGTPATSNMPSPNINYSTAGANNAILVTTNMCGSDTSVIDFTVTNNATTMASFTTSDTTIDCGGSINYDGSISINTDTYSWIFNGGTPGSSASTSESVTYNTPGSFVTQLISSNLCGSSDTASYLLTVLNNCNAGINESETGITGYYSYPMQGFVIRSAEGFAIGMTAGLYNELGQLIYTRNVVENTNQVIIPTEGLRAGIYIAQLSGNNIQRSFKFVLI